MKTALCITSSIILWGLSPAWAQKVTVQPHTTLAAQEAANQKAWYVALKKALDMMPRGGGYMADGAASQALMVATAYDPSRGRLLLRPKQAVPSFCSSAVYLAVLMALQEYERILKRGVLTTEAWQALMPQPLVQHDGTAPWGWANANGPGFAVLISKLGAGVSFDDWRVASPGDVMKIWWTDAIGASERGHLTILLGHTKDTVTFWSSNMATDKEEGGYGRRTIPKTQVARVLFTRITKPVAFNNAPKIGTNEWLQNLLKVEVTPDEMRKHAGVR